MPMSVGRIYKLAASVCGTHSWSTETSCAMHLMYSSPSNVGNPDRLADRFMRFMFMLGRNMRILPSTPRYAFMPSNNCARTMKQRKVATNEGKWYCKRWQKWNSTSRGEKQHFGYYQNISGRTHPALRMHKVIQLIANGDDIGHSCCP